MSYPEDQLAKMLAMQETGQAEPGLNQAIRPMSLLEQNEHQIKRLEYQLQQRKELKALLEETPQLEKALSLLANVGRGIY